MMWNSVEMDEDQEVFRLQQEKERLPAMLNGEQEEKDDQAADGVGPMEQMHESQGEEDDDDEKLQRKKIKLQEESEEQERTTEGEPQLLQDGVDLVEQVNTMNRYIKKLVQDKVRIFVQGHNHLNRIKNLEEELQQMKEQIGNQPHVEMVNFLKDQVIIRDQEIVRLQSEVEALTATLFNLEEQLLVKQTESQQGDWTSERKHLEEKLSEEEEEEEGRRKLQDEKVETEAENMPLEERNKELEDQMEEME